MGRRTRSCYLCNETYQYCSTCSQDRTKPSWMSEFHSENCKNIFDIATRFNMQMLTKEESMEAMSQCDLSNKENFRPSVQNTLSKIFKVEEEPKVRRSRKVIIPAVDEDTTVEAMVATESIVVENTHEVIIENE